MENVYFYSKNPEIKGLLQAKPKEKKPEIIFRDTALEAAFDGVFGGEILLCLLFTKSDNKYIFYSEYNEALKKIFREKSGCIYTASLYQNRNKARRINGGYKSLAAYTVTGCDKRENLYMYIMDIFTDDCIEISRKTPDKNHLLDCRSRKARKSREQILTFLKDRYPALYEIFCGL